MLELSIVPLEGVNPVRSNAAALTLRMAPVTLRDNSLLAWLTSCAEIQPRHAHSEVSDLLQHLLPGESSGSSFAAADEIFRALDDFQRRSLIAFARSLQS